MTLKSRKKILRLCREHRKLIITLMDSATQILDIAERRMRLAGYNAVSYRDIAAEMGIKSASLHYHFPKKENLGVALVQRYSEAFQDRLIGATDNQTDHQKKLIAFVDIYRYALQQQGLICLCAVFGAEASGLPEAVSREVKAFFEANIAWLNTTYMAMNVKGPEDRAKATLAILEGAMIVSAVNHDMSVFEAAANLALSQKE